MLMGTPLMAQQGEEVLGSDGGVSASVAVLACAAMAVLYVAILYAPTFILRLPPPVSYEAFVIRRFICATISSLLSLIATALILPIRWRMTDVFSAYGMRWDHVWQAFILPLSLTSLMYAGSFVKKILHVLDSHKEHQVEGGAVFMSKIASMGTNVSAWRNYIVAPVTEELVFRACMLPLLLCAGFKTYTAIFLCPIFFSLAHLNHMLEFYIHKDYSLLNASMAVAFQLGYTVVFGSYASFLFVRTGHLISPLVAHMFCNYMGIPAFFSRRRGTILKPKN
ncbi:OLC1v1034241C2 [Oldenlandia corymbosa var. corymbosa]|uniref:intramembrane prenyl-peptidase Rce1 n=1 Tax=Oldenlandia corymbosa var. corymbosa TaxID=529605 RepID=A0AAV1CRF7_OLDCO|nr:OLC1v1034241C2 [Oldenlandia corymbosa var. corymbosa]